MADYFAKSACSLSPIEINPTKLPGSLMTSLWASIAPVDRDIRKFCHHLTDCYTFDNFLGNKSLSPIFDRYPITAIHWPLTRSWLHHNSTTDITSFTKSAYDAFKMKSLNHILPCGDILLKHFPDLYPSTGIPCPFCLIRQDTNEHLDSNINNFNSFIENSINSYDLFSFINNDNCHRHEIYLILHQLIPQSLYNLVNSFVFNDKTTRKIIWEFLLSLHEFLYKIIWPRHCTQMRNWERSQGITSKRKRRRRRINNNTRTLSMTQPRTTLPQHNTSTTPQDPRPQRYPTLTDSSLHTVRHQRSTHPFTTGSTVLRHPNGPPIPLWLILCTSNFLHSGGWSFHIRHPSVIEFELDDSFFTIDLTFFSRTFSLMVPFVSNLVTL
ncbi:hypothetical protein RhiirA4_454007 [Rhizophagus irregularis]|uniref:Uncharacterized protein n=1 Tax=Rhizophagus irregularis TaxID=588596 RepID=A0A2I1G1U5_9GLOM|nr:hypothetical protein RhiirA4_454007 [Rhizophagus irregularis]